MAETELSIANNALGRIGGAGDQLNGEAFLEDLNGTDRVTTWINLKYPQIRKKVQKDFAAKKCPFVEGLKFADLGNDLKQDDVNISTITSVAGVVTVVTSEEHERETGNTVFLADIIGTLVADALNGTTKTITVVDTTSFTLDGVVGTADWDHSEDSGIVSYVPEIGAWRYAFNLPSDYFALVRLTDETPLTQDGVKTEYQNKVILNRDGDGFILLANVFTNTGGDGAYIEYIIDQDDPSLFSDGLVECIAMLLAAELCLIIGRDLKTRQQLLLEYKTISVPEAKAANQSQGNTSARQIDDYSGGRNGYFNKKPYHAPNYPYTF
jgi:hypothetical protein